MLTICLLFYRLIPESVRWLLAKQKDQKAKGIVCKAAKMNGVTLSVSLLESFQTEAEVIFLFLDIKITFNVENTNMMHFRLSKNLRLLINRTCCQ